METRVKESEVNAKDTSGEERAGTAKGGGARLLGEELFDVEDQLVAGCLLVLPWITFGLLLLPLLALGRLLFIPLALPLLRDRFTAIYPRDPLFRDSRQDLAAKWASSPGHSFPCTGQGRASHSAFCAARCSFRASKYSERCLLNSSRMRLRSGDVKS